MTCCSLKCNCCTPNCKKWTTLSLSLVLLVLGILAAAGWGSLFDKILRYELSLSNKNTQGYDNWQETPVPMYLEFYLFNWTNVEDVQKYQAKPNFVECGPYTFYEHHLRTNITFNENNTITYMTKRTWRFMPERTNGSLSDNITTANPIALTVANFVKNSHIIVREGVNFFFEEKNVQLAVTKTVSEFLFEGYDDALLTLAHKLNFTKFKVPYTKFGWFVERNGSITYDGVFNMYTGDDDIEKVGRIVKWNYNDTTSFYSGECGKVNGTSGELWYPPKDDESVKIFATDICSTVVLHRNGSDTLYGVTGNKYIARKDVFDNGTLYPDMKCYTSKDSKWPSGIRDVSLCKFNAPAYVSYPHFYLADEYYINAIDGMHPDPAKHQMSLLLEPKTGLPLKVNAAFQVNLLMTNITGIKLYENVKTTLMPAMWFRQSAEMTKSLTDLAKILLLGSSIGIYTGYGLLAIGCILLIVFGYVSYKKAWMSKEEEHLLNQETL